jgi:hypothetical protein
MKYVFPEMIAAQSRPGAGVTNTAMGGMYTDMMLEQKRDEQRPISFLFLEDEYNLASLWLRFTQYFGNDEHYRKFVSHFEGRFELVSVPPAVTIGDHSEKIKAILKFAETRPDDEIWVYADLHGTFRMSCTNASGMVVPFTVETGDALADVFAQPNIRLRYAGLSLRLGGRGA